MDDESRDEKELPEDLEEVRRRIAGLDALGAKAEEVLRESNGQPDGSMAIGRDIPGHTQTEEKLRQQRDEAQRYLDVAGVILVALNEQGEITLINRKGHDILGYANGELVGQDWFDTCLPARMREQVRSVFDQLVSGEVDPVERFENSILTRSGEERIIAWHNTLLTDDSGEIVGTLSSGEDVTDHRHMEEALRQSEAKFRNIVESIPMGMHMYELLPDGRLVFVGANPAADEILGVDNSQFVGQTIEEAFPSLAGTEVPENYRWVAAEGGPWNADQILYEGGRISGAFEVHAFQTSPGRMTAAFLDITDRKRAEEALARRAAQLALISEVGGQIAAVLDLDRLLHTAVRLVRESFGYLHVSLFTIDQGRGELVMRAGAGDLIDLYPSELRLKLGQGMVGWVGRQGQSLLVNDVSAEPRYINSLPDRISTRAELSVPIRLGKEIVGVLDVQSPECDAFDENDVMVMETLADQLAVAIDNARLYGALQETHEFIQSAFDALSAHIAILDDSGTILAVNASWRRFADENGLRWPDYGLGRNYLEVCEAATGRSAEGAWEAADGILEVLTYVQNGYNLEYACHSPAERRWFTMRVTRFQDVGPPRVVVAHEDITERKMVEEALRESEVRYRTLFEQANDAIVVGNEGDEILDVNRRACELLGYTREELLQMKVPDLQAPEVRGDAGTVIKGELARHTSGPFESLDICRDGTRIPVEVSTARLEGVGSGLTLSIVRDIRERKEAERSLRLRTEQLEALRQVGLEITAQLDLNVVLHSIVSRAIELLGGASGGFYLYRPRQDLLEWVVAMGRDLAPPGATLHRGEGVSGKVWESGRPLIVHNYQKWDGRAGIYEEHPFTAVIGVPVSWGRSGEGGEFLGVLDVLADPPRTFSEADTELLTLLAAQAAIAIKNAQLFRAERARRNEAEALRQASLALGSTLDTAQVLEQLLDQIGVVIPYDSANVMWVEEGVARVVHQRGYERMGTIEATAKLRLPVAEIPSLQRMFSTRRPHIVSDTQVDLDWVSLEPTGWIRSCASAPIIVRDQVVGFFSLDSRTPGFYTEEQANLLAAFAAHASAAIENARLFGEAQTAYENLKETQAQLIQSAKMAAVGELAAGVAHELNNPLTSILGFAELAVWNMDPEDPIRGDLSTILSEARRARDIVRGLLDFSRQSDASFSKVDANQLLRDTLALVRRHAEKNSVILEESYAADLPMVSLDASRMRQVFLNLITNAFDAMPQGGKLTVTSERAGDEIAVRFSDTGAGIAEHQLQRIFEPFFTTKPVGRGTGLGLSVSLGIVQEHGGRIDVESQPGRGSTFTLRLPAGVQVD